MVACAIALIVVAASCSDDGGGDGNDAVSSLGELEPWVRTVPARAESLMIADFAGIEEAIGAPLDPEQSEEFIRIMRFRVSGGVAWTLAMTRGREADELGLGIQQIDAEIAASIGDSRLAATTIVLGADVERTQDGLADGGYDTDVDGDRTVYTPGDDTDSPFGSGAGPVGIDAEVGAVVIATSSSDVRVSVPDLLAREDAAPSVLDDNETVDLLGALGPFHFLSTMSPLRGYERYPTPELIGFTTRFAEDASATESVGIVYRDEAEATAAADLLRSDAETDDHVAEQIEGATIEVVGRVLLVRLTGVEEAVFSRSMVTFDLIPPLSGA